MVVKLIKILFISKASFILFLFVHDLVEFNKFKTFFMS